MLESKRYIQVKNLVQEDKRATDREESQDTRGVVGKVRKLQGDSL